MSKMKNIGGDNNDATYRYKMPLLVTKVEGRGNGIKTVLVNMTDIAKALCCPPTYPTKYFGFTLGTQSKYSTDTERAVVNGQHTQADLDKILDTFIEKFILCPTCKLPEIGMKVKRERISIDCAACGYNGQLVTKMPKMQAYICKNPPNSAGASKEEKKKKKKKNKRRNKGEEEEEKEVVEQQEELAEATLTCDTSKEAQEARLRAEFGGISLEEETSKKKKKKKKTKSEATPDGPADMLRMFVESNPKARTKQIVDELSRIQLSRSLDDTAKVKVLLEGLLDLSDPKSVAKQLENYKKVFRKVVNSPGLQMLLLFCLEELVGVIETKLLKRTPILLNTLFDAGVLEEEVILSWANSPPESSYLVPKQVAAKIRKAVAPFIEWLEESSSESSSSSGSESD
jgi:translation initiation factor 5